MFGILLLAFTAYALTILSYDIGDQKFDSASPFYTVKFTNYRSIFITLLFLQTVNNYPDAIVIKGYEKGNSPAWVKLQILEIFSFN